MENYQDYKTESAVAADLALEANTLKFTHIADRTILVAPNAKTLDVEQFEAGRSRKRGCFTTQDIDSFVGYIENVEQPEHIKIFIDKDHMSALAILNFGADGFEQGHLDDKAALLAQKTVTFSKLLSMHNQGRCNQKVFAEFLEDWGHQVIAKDKDGNEIENAKAINAIRNMQISENAQTDSSVGDYRESRSRLESVEAKSIDGALPSYLEVTDNCYSGFADRTLKLRMGISNVDGSPVFKLEIIGLQLIEDESAKEFVEILLNERLGDIPIAIGSFKG
ncbi:DUF2303 family protein [Psychrobacter sp. 72-O-c]|uniref:DUF2303 family protein n=1 Tax=Psychrobacter sp. 72-O-c TaxID=2774125 RepID=UPI001917CB12|nr:DUF2303 family protein [Psychrobacter sp. 72-O-c]